MWKQAITYSKNEKKNAILETGFASTITHKIFETNSSFHVK